MSVGTVSKRDPSTIVGCQVKMLPKLELGRAADLAATINPANRPNEHAARLFELTPMHIAVLTTKYWGPQGVELDVGFLEETKQPLVDKILYYMNKWGQRCNVVFRYTQQKFSAKVRISRGSGGYWSYLGTDILHISRNQPTMNLEGFVLRTIDAEYDRVVCHETGHTLGFPHEHLREALVAMLDPAKTISYFQQTQGWSAQEVRDQVLTPVAERSLMGTPVDQDSIMCYQLPGDCTKDGNPIRGGTKINENDYAFAGKIYPKVEAPCPPAVITPKADTPSKKHSVRLESDSPIRVVES